MSCKEEIEIDPPNPTGTDVFCFGSYFWHGYEQCDLLICPGVFYLGVWRANYPYAGILDNNKHSAWKGDVSTGCFGHKKAELKGYDRSFYRDQIGTITTQGDVFTPFMNIYSDFDNKITSFKSRSKS
jgi:hypothetical protein